ncbi:hypothetical protein [Oceanobacillus sp. SE10311]
MMITRKEKREAEKDKKYFFEFMKIYNHFYKHWIVKSSKVLRSQ